MPKHTPEERIMQDACGASLPAAINEDATEAEAQRRYIRAVGQTMDFIHDRVFPGLARRPFDPAKLSELNHEAICDEQDERREQRERRQWEEDKGVRTP